MITGFSLTAHANPDERPIFNGMKALFVCSGVIYDSLAGHMCIPELYSECGQKQYFCVTFAAGIALVGTFYATVGSVAYYFWGSHTNMIYTLNIGHNLVGSPI